MVRYNHRTENNWKTQPIFQEKVESLKNYHSRPLKKRKTDFLDEKYKEMSCESRLLHSTVVKTRSFSTASDKIYIWRLEVTTSQDCELCILNFSPPLCSNSLFRHKRLLVHNPHASKKYAQLHMCLNVMLAPSTTTAYPKIPKDNCTFVRHRQLCQRAGWEALRIEWAERGNWICEPNLLRFLFLFLTNSEGLCDADL